MPLGFLVQAIASFSFSAVQLHWIPISQSHVVAWAVLSLTVPLQALSATVGFWTRDSVAASGTGLLAGGWAALAVATVSTPPGQTSPGLGVVLMALGVALLVPTTAAVGTKLAAALVFLLSAARFAATGLHHWTSAASWQAAAGWLGLVLCVASVYGAFAFELEAAAGRTVLPIGRSSSPRRDAAGGGHRTPQQS